MGDVAAAGGGGWRGTDVAARVGGRRAALEEFAHLIAPVGGVVALDGSVAGITGHSAGPSRAGAETAGVSGGSVLLGDVVRAGTTAGRAERRHRNGVEGRRRRSRPSSHHRDDRAVVVAEVIVQNPAHLNTYIIVSHSSHMQHSNLTQFRQFYSTGYKDVMS